MWLLRRRLRPVPPGEGLPLVLDRPGLSLVGASAWAAAIPGGRGWRTRHRGVDRSGVILVHPNARPVPPVAGWAAVYGGVADVAAAMESRAVGRRWAWRCAGLVRQAGGLPCVQPRLDRWPSRPALTRCRVVRGGGAARCAGRRCRPGARARGAPAPAAPDTRRAGRRPRAVPVR